jgi:RNA polymerase sigma-70 factor (ECF subfamily)
MATANPQSTIRNPQSSQSEGEYLARAKAGDREAFSHLVNFHQNRVYNALVRFTGDRDRALDLAQKAFLNAWMKLAQFEAKAAFGTWVYRIAINLAISEARGRRHEAVSLSRVGGGHEEGADFDPPAAGNGPSAALEARETQAMVQSAIRSLDPEFREIILLKDIEDRSYDEIAEILEIPKGTVRSRLHRARMELKAALERKLPKEG